MAGRARLALRGAVWVVGCAPAVALAVAAARGGLGANPIEAASHETGRWALRLLLATLAVTPLRQLTGWHDLVAARRPLGLFAFAWACTHFAIWSLLDLGLDLPAMAEDVVERPYVTAGFAAFVLLVPLAITSTRGWIRRLGRRWLRLHRLVYASAALAVLHHLWLVKADLRPPRVHAAVLLTLLAAHWLPLRGVGRRGAARASQRSGSVG